MGVSVCSFVGVPEQEYMSKPVAIKMYGFMFLGLDSIRKLLIFRRSSDFIAFQAEVMIKPAIQNPILAN